MATREELLKDWTYPELEKLRTYLWRVELALHIEFELATELGAVKIRDRFMIYSAVKNERLTLENVIKARNELKREKSE